VAQDRVLSNSPQSEIVDPAQALRLTVELLQVHYPKVPIDQLTHDLHRAYEVAAIAHGNQWRKSGEPYITHPLAVTEILADLGMNTPTLIAALLHDTIEDTDYNLAQLKSDFGNEVASLVDGVTKLDRVTFGKSAEAETVRKMVVAMAKDIRVLVIKLADRLHNARTWKFVSSESAERKARETLDIYAPLAHRLGMNAIKWELEDLSFATLYPKMYDEITRLVAERAPSRESFTTQVVGEVTDELRAAGVHANVHGRPKHYYSVYQKMVVRGRDFADIYDLVGIRVLVDDVKDCYAALGTIHTRWNPVPGRFKDYIAMPKFNLYQSLHTTVIGPEGKPVEIQIRTHDMHRRAEYGIAAHWKYKQGNADPNSASEIEWLKRLHDWQRETEDPSEFLDSLRFDLNSGEVYVFTPKGDVVALPTGATPVDFAFSVNTDVGYKTDGAKVNGRLVPLESRLQNGDVIEIITAKGENHGPSRDWLNFVRSPRARSKIKQWFTKERREEAIESGRDLIAREMRKQGLPIQKILSGESLIGLAHDLRFSDLEALYASVGDGHTSASSIISKLVSLSETEEVDDLPESFTPQSTRKGSDSGVKVVGGEDIWIKLAKCCTPVPGDQIVGFVTRASGVSVHRDDCTNGKSLIHLQPEREIAVEWIASAHSTFLVNIQVEALDRARLLSDVTRTLSDQHVNILSAAVHTSRDRIAFSRFTFEMADATHLETVLKAVRNISGVYDVYRVTNV
jgi:GTP pyrophosphokinase